MLAKSPSQCNYGVSASDPSTCATFPPPGGGGSGCTGGSKLSPDGSTCVCTGTAVYTESELYGNFCLCPLNGQVYSPATGCSCPTGQAPLAGGCTACIAPATLSQDGQSCDCSGQPNSTPNASGFCLCNAGYSFASTGGCQQVRL